MISSIIGPQVSGHQGFLYLSDPGLPELSVTTRARRTTANDDHQMRPGWELVARSGPHREWSPELQWDRFSRRRWSIPPFPKPAFKYTLALNLQMLQLWVVVPVIRARHIQLPPHVRPLRANLSFGAVGIPLR